MLGYEIKNTAAKKAQITIEGEISWWANSSSAFTRQVDALLVDGIEDLDLYLNSPGGSMFDANEIGNQIARFKGVKKAKLGALCASACTLIACYCDEVEASENTQYMIHDPIMAVKIEHVSDWDSQKQAYINLRTTALELYVRKTGLTMKELDEMMRKTSWMTAKQAKEKSFVDSIAARKSTLSEDAKNVLLRYKNTCGIPACLNYVFESSYQSNSSQQIEPEGVKIAVAYAELLGLDTRLIEDLAVSNLEGTLQMLSQLGAPQMSSNRQVKQFSMSFTEMSKKDPEGLRKLLVNDRGAFADLFQTEFGYRPTEAELHGLLN